MSQRVNEAGLTRLGGFQRAPSLPPWPAGSFFETLAGGSLSAPVQSAPWREGLASSLGFSFASGKCFWQKVQTYMWAERVDAHKLGLAGGDQSRPLSKHPSLCDLVTKFHLERSAAPGSPSGSL